MGIASSVLNRLTPSPHKAAGGLLEALSKGATAPLKRYADYTRAVGKYSGLTQMGSDAYWSATHPLDRITGKGRAAEQRMEVPFGPGKAAVGGLEARLLKRQAAAQAKREAAAGQGKHMDAALSDPYEKELAVYGVDDMGRRVSRTMDLQRTLREHPKAVVYPKTNRWGGSPRGGDEYRQTFILTKDGAIHMADDWANVHHPDLVEAAGALPGYKSTGHSLPSRQEMQEAGILQGEITHAKDPSGAMYGDRMRVSGWGQVQANEAQRQTLREIAEMSHGRGVSLEHASLVKAAEPKQGTRTGPSDLEGQARSLIKRLGHGTSGSPRLRGASSSDSLSDIRLETPSWMLRSSADKQLRAGKTSDYSGARAELGGFPLKPQRPSPSLLKAGVRRTDAEPVYLTPDIDKFVKKHGPLRPVAKNVINLRRANRGMTTKSWTSH